MTIDYQDQRKDKATEITVDADVLRRLAEMAGVTPGTLVKVRVRDGHGPYGFTKQIAPGAYRVVINVRYSKPKLSEAARYVVANTTLHELRHVGQGIEAGWHKLSNDYNGWSETAAREVGRSIKGRPEFYAFS